MPRQATRVPRRPEDLPGRPGSRRSCQQVPGCVAGKTINPDALSCRAWCRFRELRGGGEQAQCQVMTNFTELTPVPSDRPVPVADPLRLAVAAYLARFKDSSREHTESTCV